MSRISTLVRPGARRHPTAAALAAAAIAAGSLVAGALAATTASAAEALRVCATTPDLASLVRRVGGDRVAVTAFVKPTEDPHFAEAKPSFVKALSEADLFVENGLDLEVGYAPPLLQGARNPRLLPGNAGFLDASRSITPRDVPTGTVDRSQGDVHPYGNPHYLLDPLNGVRVARAIADKLAELDAAGKSDYDARAAELEKEVYRALVGQRLADKYGADVPKLALLFEHGRLAPYLESQGESSQLAGWLGDMAPHFGAKAVQDHRIWTYFAARFGLDLVGELEPKPGIPPTTRHLNELVDLMRAQDVRLVLASAYYDPRYAEFLSEKVGAKVLKMANQVGAVPGADGYVGMIDHDVREVVRALGAKP
ncbi:MAG TPA: metal ABC transporter substrate-binding protein [Candidatus Binatia bacterium]|nr:metal ABC transporter substrate-binding protein [Candidatus Binatia bacterium]